MLFRRKPRNRRLESKNILDVKVRSSVRRQTWMRRAGVLMGVLFGVTFGLFVAWRGIDWILQETVYQNPAFALHQFDLQTDGVIPLEQLRSWSGVKLRDNLLALDLGRVKRDLEMVPAIESVQVERILPHTLRVRVTERVPVARLIFPGKASGGATNPPTVYTIDGAGYFMFPIESPQAGQMPGLSVAHLPVLTGVPLSEVRPGRPSESPQMRAALQLLQAFERSSLTGLVDFKEIDVSAPCFLSVTTGQSCAVMFGQGGFDQQLRRWRALHDHGRKVGRNLAWIDLSVTNNVPARWLEASVVPAPPAKPAKPPGYKKKNV